MGVKTKVVELQKWGKTGRRKEMKQVICNERMQSDFDNRYAIASSAGAGRQVNIHTTAAET